MDGENDSIEVIVTRGGHKLVKGIDYSLYCQRSTKDKAELIRDDLIEQGCKSLVNREDGYFQVWWART